MGAQRRRFSAVRYLALATDYDGTLAEQGTVRPETVAAVERLRKSGRRVVLVTGRELRDLQTVFDRFDLFDLVVAENGALLYRPQTREEKCVAEPPPPALAERLRQRGATPLHRGRVIVATREPYEVAALELVRELGLEWQVIFNKGAVMLLPSGVNKQTGLSLALEQLGLSMRNTVAVGDAENDHAMLAASECAVAVANALDSLKERADLVTRGPRGAGVEELIDRILEDDLRSVVVARHALLLGTRRDGTEVHIAPAGPRLMVTVHPQHVSAAMLEAVDTALAVGKAPERMLQAFGRVPPVELEDGEVLAWSNGQAEPLRLVQGKAQVRHRRKYAAGDLGGEAFVFRGPQGKLKLRAPNLGIFLLMAEGVDDETWMHHLAQRDYSKWFRMALKDDGLAADAEQIEGGGGLESRHRIRDAIEKRYALSE